MSYRNGRPAITLGGSGLCLGTCPISAPETVSMIAIELSSHVLNPVLRIRTSAPGEATGHAPPLTSLLRRS